ncbi:MAG: 2-oxo acid dehydrogenase subunit E2 [Bacteroidales bacterium]|nr:2-oxo acid dehydrogenase subunit E2 [Bacteroidales bacterium]
MATFEVKMPKLGESVTEGTIVSWAVKEGDIIAEDDVLFEVTTAKVNAEVPSPVGGTLMKINFKEGDTVPVGEVVALVALEGEETGESEQAATEPSPTQESASAGAVVAQTPSMPTSTVDSTPQTAAAPSVAAPVVDERWYSPVVLQLAKEAGLSQAALSTVPGTGFEGRVTKHDLQAYLKQTPAQQAVSQAVNSAANQAVNQPAAQPVNQPVNQSVNQSKNQPVSQPVSQQLVKPVATEGVQREEMDPVRRIIADRMVQSKKVSAHVTTVVEADVTRLVQWRDKHKGAFKQREGISLTFLPAIVSATTRALVDFPRVNASVEDHTILLKKHIHMGIAVSLADNNLVVPVIKNADKLNINGLAHSIEDLAAKARNNKLKVDDIEGGTFTITNFGTFKNLIGTPIINQPQVAILGVGYIEKKPAVVETPEGDVIAIRYKMYLSLTYDHRIIDGSLGGAFVRRIADYLEQWDPASAL